MPVVRAEFAPEQWDAAYENLSMLAEKGASPVATILTYSPSCRSLNRSTALFGRLITRSKGGRTLPSERCA